MEQELNPVSEKAEEQSGSLLLTYFEGDINSMVEAHFSRALSKASKPKGDGTRSKRSRRPPKSEVASSSNRDMQSPPWMQSSSYPQGRIHFGTHEELQTNPRLPLNPPAMNSTIWPPGARQGATGLVLPPMMYSSAPSPEGLVMTERQYTNSLLGLLNSDTPDLGTVMVAPSKQEFVPGWTRHPGFGDQMAPDHNLDSGVQMIEKKDLYWY